MNLYLKIFLLIGTIIFFIYVFYTLKREKLSFKFSIIWLCCALFLVVLALFDGIVNAFADMMHIIEPTNALFMFTIFLVLVICFNLSISVSRNDKRIRKLTQEIAFLKNKNLGDK